MSGYQQQSCAAIWHGLARILTLFSPRNKKRLALFFGVIGIGIMGADLLITGSFFVHVAELMVASIACFIIALVLDRRASHQKAEETS